MTARRTSAVGAPMLVNLPDLTDTDYRDSREGGLAFFFLVKVLKHPADRQVCMAGYVYWPDQDVIVNDTYVNAPLGSDSDDDGYREWYPQALDAGLLIGSTGMSLYSESRGAYFAPEYRDLTESGQHLFHVLTAIYSAEPSIVTLLDT